MLGRHGNRRSAVTFDFGAAGIRAHQFRARGSRISLWDALELDLPRGDGADSNESPVVDIARLARLVEQGRFLGRDVALILSPPDVQFSALHLPEQVLTQEPVRIQQALKCEVSRDMRLDPTNLEVRYWRLPPGHYQGLNVMAIAISVEQVTRWFDECGRHRLNLRRIDVSPQALVGLARRMWTPSSTDLWGILDLGFRRTTFTAVVGEVPTYVRCLSASVDDLTRRLSAGLDVSHAVADRLRREYGILPDSRGVRDISAGWQSVRPEDLPRVLFGLLRGTLGDLVEEINKCFSYVLKSFPDLRTGRLFLAGGGANLKGLPEFLEIHVGLPVALLAAETEAETAQWQNPLPDVRFRPEAAASVGGALLDMGVV